MAKLGTRKLGEFKLGSWRHYAPAVGENTENQSTRSGESRTTTDAAHATDTKTTTEQL